MFTINLWNRGYVIPEMFTINLWNRGYVIPSMFTINLWNRGYVIPYVYNQSVKQRLRFSLCLQSLSICETEATLLHPCSRKGEGGMLFHSPEGGGGYTILPLSVCPSKIFFVAFFSVTVDGRHLIFGHKRHIGIPYCGYRFWTRQIPTSCFPPLLIFIHIEHICSFFVNFFSATIDGRNLIFGYKLHIGTPYCGKRFWTHQIPTSCLPILLIFIHI